MKRKSFLLAGLVAVSIALSACGAGVSTPVYQIVEPTLKNDKNIITYNVTTKATEEKEFRKIVEDIKEKNKQWDAVWVFIHRDDKEPLGEHKASAGIANTESGASATGVRVGEYSFIMKEKKEESPVQETSSMSEDPTYSSPESEQKYVKTAVNELLEISNDVSNLSKYDFNDVPQDIQAFQKWGELIKSDLNSLQTRVSLNLIHTSYSNNHYTPLKFREINNRALNSLYDLQKSTKTLYDAIDTYKTNDVKALEKRLLEQGEGLKNLADEIVKVSNYQQ